MLPKKLFVLSTNHLRPAALSISTKLRKQKEIIFANISFLNYLITIKFF